MLKLIYVQVIHLWIKNTLSIELWERKKFAILVISDLEQWICNQLAVVIKWLSMLIGCVCNDLFWNRSNLNVWDFWLIPSYIIRYDSFAETSIHSHCIDYVLFVIKLVIIGVRTQSNHTTLLWSKHILLLLWLQYLE